MRGAGCRDWAQGLRAFSVASLCICTLLELSRVLLFGGQNPKRVLESRCRGRVFDASVCCTSLQRSVKQKTNFSWCRPTGDSDI